MRPCSSIRADLPLTFQSLLKLPNPPIICGDPAGSTVA
jgi:hypothetical protein